jgi:hypothetical protein
MQQRRKYQRKQGFQVMRWVTLLWGKAHRIT